MSERADVVRYLRARAREWFARSDHERATTAALLADEIGRDAHHVDAPPPSQAQTSSAVRRVGQRPPEVVVRPRPHATGEICRAPGCGSPLRRDGTCLICPACGGGGGGGGS